jgi:hypothetical protein
VIAGHRLHPDGSLSPHAAPGLAFGARPMPDLYRVLQVQRDADHEVVKAAYRAPARTRRVACSTMRVLCRRASSISTQVICR